MTAAHAGDTWVSDGNFALATFDIRLPRADLIVWIDRPRIICALRAVTRAFRTSESHTIRNLPKVLKFIWNFDRVNRPLIQAARREHGPKVPLLHLSTAREIQRFLADPNAGGTAH